MALMKKKPAADTSAPAAETKTASTPAASFETPNDDETETVDHTETKSDSRVAAAAEVHAVAVARTAPSAVAVVGKRAISPFENLKEVYKVSYDTLEALKASQGNISIKSSGVSLGDSVAMELLSFQANFVITPNEDSEEAGKLVKYSDDGKVCSDGTEVSEYLRELKDAGYDKAKLVERCVLVGALTDPGKQKSLMDTLVQIDLPPTSKAQFERYQIQCAFDIKRSKYTLEQASMLRLTCKVENGVKGGKKTDWTVVLFTREQ